MQVKKRDQGIFFQKLFFLDTTDHENSFPKLDQILLGCNGYFKFITINSTLTLNNFFVLRLRDPNPFDFKNLDVGNSFN